MCFFLATIQLERPNNSGQSIFHRIDLLSHPVVIIVLQWDVLSRPPPTLLSLQERWAWLPRGAAFVRSNDKEDQHYRGQTIKAQSEWYLFVVMVDKIRGLSGSLFILLVGFKKSGIGEGGGRERTVDKQRNRRWTFLRSFRKDRNFY